MKRIASIFALGLALAGPAFAADPAEGVWKTEVDDGAYAHVEMVSCGQGGELICGRIARTFNSSGEYQSENIGEWLVRNMEPLGNGQYKGSVWRPSNDKVYTGDMNVTGNTLRLRGCVGICTALTSASQTWTRVE